MKALWRKIWTALMLVAVATGSARAEDVFVLVDVSGSIDQRDARHPGTPQQIETMIAEGKRLVSDLVSARFQPAQYSNWKVDLLDDPIAGIVGLDPDRKPLIEPGDRLAIMPFGDKTTPLGDGVKISPPLQSIPTDFETFFAASYPTNYSDKQTYLTLAKAHSARRAAKAGMDSYLLFMVTDATNDPKLDYTEDEEALARTWDSKDYVQAHPYLGVFEYAAPGVEERNFQVEIWRVQLREDTSKVDIIAPREDATLPPGEVAIRFQPRQAPVGTEFTIRVVDANSGDPVGEAITGLATTAKVALSPGAYVVQIDSAVTDLTERAFTVSAEPAPKPTPPPTPPQDPLNSIEVTFPDEPVDPGYVDLPVKLIGKVNANELDVDVSGPDGGAGSHSIVTENEQLLARLDLRKAGNYDIKVFGGGLVDEGVVEVAADAAALTIVQPSGDVSVIRPDGDTSPAEIEAEFGVTQGEAPEEITYTISGETLATPITGQAGAEPVTVMLPVGAYSVRAEAPERLPALTDFNVVATRASMNILTPRDRAELDAGMIKLNYSIKGAKLKRGQRVEITVTDPTGAKQSHKAPANGFSLKLDTAGEHRIKVEAPGVAPATIAIVVKGKLPVGLILIALIALAAAGWFGFQQFQKRKRRAVAVD